MIHSKFMPLLLMIARLTPRSPPCVLLSARHHLRCRCHCSTLYPDARVFPALLVVCTLETFTVYCDASPARCCCRKIHALTLFTHLAPTQIRTPGYVHGQGNSAPPILLVLTTAHGQVLSSCELVLHRNLAPLRMSSNLKALEAARLSTARPMSVRAHAGDTPPQTSH